MEKAKIRKRTQRPKEAASSPGDSFGRELADINAALTRLESSFSASCERDAKRSVRYRPRRKQAVADHAPMLALPPPIPAETLPPSDAAASSLNSSPESSGPVTVEASAMPANGSIPNGTNLAEPKNFWLMPPAAELEQGAANLEEYRQRLSRHLAFAMQVLQTSGVPAAVWREWRTFEKATKQRLLELNEKSGSAALRM